MAEATNPQPEPVNDSQSLRKTLEQLRRDAEQEVMRLNRRIAERVREADVTPVSSAEQLAMEQELTILHQTLASKEQTLDHITEECRRLEDALEDQNLTLDGLKQEMDRKEAALKNAREEIERMRRELAEHLKAPPAMIPAPAQTAPSPPQLTTSPRWTWIGAALLLMLLAVVGGLLSLKPAWLRHVFPAAPQPLRAPAVATVLPIPTTQPVAVVPTAVMATPSIQHDPLRHGGQAPDLASLAGGSFQMGKNSLSSDDFSPAHRVQVKPFRIGVTEVTYQDYDRFTHATGRSLASDYGWGRGKRPVVGVSWDDARAYAGWLSQETGKHYRLPTEAEWEFAARAGTASPYWWGFGIEPGLAACFDCGSVWDNRSTAPVRSFPANPFGLYDTAGNAMEWVEDCYHPNYEDAPDVSRAWIDGICTHRVARGGAFNKPSSSMRIYDRARFEPDARLNMLGFRVARDD